METRHIAKLFLASPSDTGAERKIVHEVVNAWNRSTGGRRGWHVEVFDYEKNVAPSYGRDGQAIIFEASGSLRKYAFFVGILKHRFGSPTPRAASGTKEEFQSAVKAYNRSGRIEIMLYFSNASLTATDDNTLQNKLKVNAFRTSVQDKSFYKTFRSQQDFRAQFSEHFAGKMEDFIKKNSGAKTAPSKKPKPSNNAAPEPTKTRKSEVATQPKPTPPKAVATKVKPIAELKTPRPKSKPTATTASQTKAPATVSSSGLRLLLGDEIFQCRPVTGSGNNLCLQIITRTGEQESLMRRWCDNTYYNHLSYAHGHTAGHIRINKHEHESAGRQILWKLDVALQPFSLSGWNSLEDCERRATELLIGRPGNAGASADEYSQSRFIANLGAMNAVSKAKPNLFAELWTKTPAPRRDFLYRAFLHAVYRLQKEGICDDVLHLKLGPVKNNSLAVSFTGRISSNYGIKAQDVKVTGLAPLD